MLGVCSAVVVEELIVGAQLGIDLAHVLLDDGGNCIVVGVAGLTSLEEDVRVLSGAPENRMVGVQSPVAERLNGVHVDHVLQVCIIPDLDLLQLMRGAEAVEEV